MLEVPGELSRGMRADSTHTQTRRFVPSGVSVRGQRAADNNPEKDGQRGAFFVLWTRGDGRLCDALIILKQSPVARPGIVQKSRGKREKGYIKAGTGTDGVGAERRARESSSVCSSAGKRHASGARLGLLSRANEIPSRPRSANRACRHTRDPL